MGDLSPFEGEWYELQIRGPDHDDEEMWYTLDLPGKPHCYNSLEKATEAFQEYTGWAPGTGFPVPHQVRIFHVQNSVINLNPIFYPEKNNDG